jgi:hypothetical protein
MPQDVSICWNSTYVLKMRVHETLSDVQKQPGKCDYITCVKHILGVNSKIQQYDMLTFAVEYQKAIDAISADCRMDFQQFELSEQEWKMAVQLRDVLTVGLICRAAHCYRYRTAVKNSRYST